MLDFDLVFFGVIGDLVMWKFFVLFYEIYIYYGFKKDFKIIVFGCKELFNEEFLAFFCEKI